MGPAQKTYVNAVKGGSSGGSLQSVMVCRGKGSCSYQWTWSTKPRCHRCSKLLAELPVPPWQSAARPWVDHGVASPSPEQIGAGLANLFGEGHSVLEAFKEANIARQEAKRQEKPAWMQRKEVSQTIGRKQKALETARAGEEKGGGGRGSRAASGDYWP